MADDRDVQVDAHLFDAKRDTQRYGKISGEVCEVLAKNGLEPAETMAFLCFYFAHVMLHHFCCNEEMFRNNLLVFANCSHTMFRWMAENTEDNPDATQLRH